MTEDKKREFIRSEFQSTSEIKKDYKANPFEKYSGKFSTSFSTLVLGIILSVIGLVILGYSEGLDNETNTIRRSPLIQEENLIRSSGTIKLAGKPVLNKELSVSGFDGSLVYYRRVVEEKIEDKWVVTQKQHFFAPFSMGRINVDASNAQFEFNLMNVYENETEDTREFIQGVSAEDKIIVIGNLKNNEIKDGNVFIITNKTNKDLIDSISNFNRTEWWLYKVGALLLITLGIASFVLPILTFLDIFPKLGLAALGLIFLFAFLAAAMLVFISAIVITFWWFIFVIVGFVIILLIRIKSKKRYSPISFVP